MSLYVEATGEGLKKGRAHKTNKFLLTMLLRTMASELGEHLSLELDGPGTSEIWSQDLGNGRLEVTYNVDEPGLYELHVLYEDTPIRGSPFRLVIR